jgi:WD40 repeat protein
MKKACENKTVQVKSLITGSDVHELPVFESNITCLAVSNDCKHIYVACADTKLYLYNILTCELIAILIEQNSSINNLKISSDNSFLFSSSGVKK